MTRFRIVSIVAAAMVSFATVSAGAQQPILTGKGWEAFPNVDYQGGDATQPKRLLQGMLVLTDSTIALHACAWVNCTPPRDTTKLPFVEKPYFTIRLADIKEVASSSEVRGPSTASRIMIGGALAGDRKEELFGLVYETAASAEAPVFRTQQHQSGAVEAKIRFRLKKLGIDLKGNER